MASGDADARYAIYYLNSLLSVPSCLLVSELSELADGVVLCEVATLLLTNHLAQGTRAQALGQWRMGGQGAHGVVGTQVLRA
jgi:hypothetical protein